MLKPGTVRAFFGFCIMQRYCIMWRYRKGENMRDTNSRTDHSMQLRKETAAKRRKRVLDEGGLDFRALIEREHTDMLAEIVEHSRFNNKTEVFRDLIEREYRLIKGEAHKNRTGLDQLDIIDDTPSKGSFEYLKRTPAPVRYELNGEQWSGRGRKPLWVLAFKESGGKLEDIEIPSGQQ